ncbi:hypothetical protein, partial [Mesorhizobium sp. M2E.F.Ca.ET.209.01.1.1]|uniref:hypothetical protein n=1 Tax=Mesorhizobium sp. M2E.F.Ca.ET.209.01.1.1 TaxID=2500526 RepID=UPI001AEEFC35
MNIFDSVMDRTDALQAGAAASALSVKTKFPLGQDGRRLPSHTPSQRSAASGPRALEDRSMRFSGKTAFITGGGTG